MIEAMFRRLAGPVAPAGLDGAFYGGCRWPRWTGSCSTCRTRWPTGPRSAASDHAPEDQPISLTRSEIRRLFTGL